MLGKQRVWAGAVAGLILLLALPVGAEANAHEDLIVVLRDTSAWQVPDRARALADDHRGSVEHVYSQAVRAFSGRFPRHATQRLAQHPHVAWVESDAEVRVAAQTAPPGVRRIFALDNPAIPIDGADDVRVDADIAVIDTGVDHEHPDLNVVWRVDCTRSGCPFGGPDSNGHGTHVAGTAAAVDNERGVGVAPGARLWSVRVLRTSSGRLSNVIAGVNWVVANADMIDVATMSLGSASTSATLDAAIAAAVDAGVVVVAAAGNEGQDAAGFSPANHPDTIAVSAIADYDGLPGGEADPTCTVGGSSPGDDDTLAVFSNFGALVDVAAPGACISSTWPGGGRNTISGTSMAAPHVAGAVALLVSGGGAPTDRAGVEAVRHAIVDAGNDSWRPGWTGHPADEDPSFDREPILDVSDDAVFAPATVAVTTPTVELAAPLADSILTGNVTLSATGEDEAHGGGILRVDFLVNGALVGSDATSPYSISWDSTTVPDGTRDVRARAWNAAGVTATSPARQVVVDNTPPEVDLTNPQPNVLVRGTVEVVGEAADTASGLASLRLVAAGAELAAGSSSPLSAQWDTTAVGDGQAQILVEATDRAGHVATAMTSVTVDNTPPTVEVLSPATDAEVAGPVAVEVAATDANGIDAVEILVDGQRLAMLDAPPFAATWDTTTTADDGLVAISAVATDLAGNETASAPVAVVVRNTPEPTGRRLSGPDRFATAAAISAEAFPDGADVVYVATGLAFPDALAAGGVAAGRDAPLLLAATTLLPAATSAEIERLGPAEIILVGGASAISSAVEQALAEHAPVRRLAGTDRFDTAARLALDSYEPSVPVAFIASGLGFADALSGGPAAAALGGPLLLATSDGVPGPTAEALRALSPGAIIVLGGSTVVEQSVLDELAELTSGTVTRLAGADRFSTSVAVSAHLHPAGADTAFLATGGTFADALAGTPAAALADAPILLVGHDVLPATVADELARLGAVDLVALGGPAAISETVLHAALAAVRR